jgi:hypothetical protein
MASVCKIAGKIRAQRIMQILTALTDPPSVLGRLIPGDWCPSPSSPIREILGQKGNREIYLADRDISPK